MSYSSHDTDWKISAKGNHWRRIQGKPISVGRKRDGTFWALADGVFAEGTYRSLPEAMAAAEAKLQHYLRSRGY